MAVANAIDVQQFKGMFPRWFSQRRDVTHVPHRGRQTGQSWQLSHACSLRLGRDSQCDITLPDRRVSRYHARIFWKENHYYVEDMNSKNGTYLNGQPVITPTPLHDRDVLQIALCRKLTLSLRDDLCLLREGEIFYTK